MKVYLKYNGQEEQKRRELENDIRSYKGAIEAWQKVERVHKKDGGDFARFERNFTNCHLDIMYSCKYLKVYYQSYRYESDDIYLWDYRKEQELTVDETEQKIKERIENYKRNVIECEKALKSLSKTYEKIQKELDRLVERLDSEDESTNRLIRDVLRYVEFYG